MPWRSVWALAELPAHGEATAIDGPRGEALWDGRNRQPAGQARLRGRSLMLDKKSKTMRTAGAWSITMGITCLVVGVAVGVGCIVTCGCLLGGSKK